MSKREQCIFDVSAHLRSKHFGLWALDVMDPVLKQALEKSKSAREKLLARTSPPTVAREPWVDVDNL